MYEKLTVLLTLKGRVHHTLRWLKYANDNHFPFLIYIADGQPSEEVRDFLSNPHNICNIAVEYHEYDDRDRAAFYQKTLDSMNRITSEYLIYCGNNNFLFVPGLMKCIHFLEENKDYVCAGGGVSRMYMNPYDIEFLYGEVTGFSYDGYDKDGTIDGDQNYKMKSYNEGTVVERMISLLMDYRLIFCHVYKTTEIRKVASDIVELNFISPNIHEYFMALRTLTLGKVKSFPEYLTYIQSTGTSMSAGHPENSRNLPELLHYFLHSTYSDDIKKATRRLEEVLSALGELKTGKELELLRRAFTYRHYVSLPCISIFIEHAIKLFAEDQDVSRAVCHAMSINKDAKIFLREEGPASCCDFKSLILSKLKNRGCEQGFLDELNVELDKVKRCLSNS